MKKQKEGCSNRYGVKCQEVKKKGDFLVFSVRGGSSYEKGLDNLFVRLIVRESNCFSVKKYGDKAVDGSKYP